VSLPSRRGEKGSTIKLEFITFNMLSHHCHAGLRALCFVWCSRCVEGVSTVAHVGSTGICNL
jgi:hypothetical protein